MSAIRLRDTTPRVRGLLTSLFRLRREMRYNPACAGTTVYTSWLYLSVQIQPRVCGDYQLTFFSCSATIDTTPRVRGLLRVAGVRKVIYRYNPACAGTTPAHPSAPSPASIQPRVCGDYGCGSTTDARPADTTPRVRGLRRDSYRVGSRLRYTPACAGTTYVLPCPKRGRPIQPRVCGDYSLTDKAAGSTTDTTPRVRGLPRKDAGMTQTERYNPACAGTTSARCRSAMRPAIQPRVCGDYFGSIALFAACIAIRYNPACAGTTARQTCRGTLWPIQPRVCGDYSLPCCVSASVADTTPRVRGLLPCAPAHPRAKRYNPACAGTTTVAPCAIGIYAIQPRVCGDYCLQTQREQAEADTTPRVRGLLQLLFFRLHVDRYNPACAGTTDQGTDVTRRRMIQPRVCGDYTTTISNSCAIVDTTPRVRGLLIPQFRQDCGHRYNPACAGTTSAIFWASPSQLIQPRVCGDYQLCRR